MVRICFFFFSLFILFSFQLSFFLWTTLSLFLLFFFAFIFTSLIAHICSSVIENECSALRFFVVQAGDSLCYHGEKLYHHFSASLYDSRILESYSKPKVILVLNLYFLCGDVVSLNFPHLK